ncbi:hypothetical protein ACLB2K_052692 [Fragaria x ananassa]
MPSDFIGREDQWEFLCEHFESDAFKRLSLTNKRNRREKTMHHHTGSSPIIYTMEELRIQGKQLPIIKGFEKTYIRACDEGTTKKYVFYFYVSLANSSSMCKSGYWAIEGKSAANPNHSLVQTLVLDLQRSAYGFLVEPGRRLGC